MSIIWGLSSLIELKSQIWYFGGESASDWDFGVVIGFEVAVAVGFKVGVGVSVGIASPPQATAMMVTRVTRLPNADSLTKALTRIRFN